jgi:hypothetical protein
LTRRPLPPKLGGETRGQGKGQRPLRARGPRKAGFVARQKRQRPLGGERQQLWQAWGKRPEGGWEPLGRFQACEAGRPARLLPEGKGFLPALPSAEEKASLLFRLPPERLLLSPLGAGGFQQGARLCSGGAFAG